MESELWTRIGARIRAARELSEMSQKDLAALTGLTRTSIANAEAGRQEVPLTKLLKFADALSLTLAALISDDPLPERPAVRVTELHALDCAEHGRLSEHATSKEAYEARRDHIRHHLTNPDILGS